MRNNTKLPIISFANHHDISIVNLKLGPTAHAKARLHQRGYVARSWPGREIYYLFQEHGQATRCSRRFSSPHISAVSATKYGNMLPTQIWDEKGRRASRAVFHTPVHLNNQLSGSSMGNYPIIREHCCLILQTTIFMSGWSEHHETVLPNYWIITQTPYPFIFIYPHKPYLCTYLAPLALKILLWLKKRRNRYTQNSKFDFHNWVQLFSCIKCPLKQNSKFLFSCAWS